jgi:hypothetical protein
VTPWQPTHVVQLHRCSARSWPHVMLFYLRAAAPHLPHGRVSGKPSTTGWYHSYCLLMVPTMVMVPCLVLVCRWRRLVRISILHS